MHYLDAPYKLKQGPDPASRARHTAGAGGQPLRPWVHLRLMTKLPLLRIGGGVGSRSARRSVSR
jgi:hypothetical protein